MKRAFCILLASFILIISIRPIDVKATAVAPAVPAEYDVTLLFMEMIFSALAANGCDIPEEYEDAKKLYDSFFSIKTFGAEPIGQVQLEDGSFVDVYGTLDFDTDGTSALEFPDEEQYTNYKVLTGGGGNSNNDQDPKFKVSGTGLIINGLLVHENFNSILDTFADEAAAGLYTAEGIMPSKCPTSAGNNFYIKTFQASTSTSNKFELYTFNSDLPFCLVLGNKYDRYSSYYYVPITNISNKVGPYYINVTNNISIYNLDGSLKANSLDTKRTQFKLYSYDYQNINYDGCPILFSDPGKILANMPIFTSIEEMQEYYSNYFPQTQLDLSGDTFINLVGKFLDPLSLAGLASRLKIAIEPLIDPVTSPAPDPSKVPDVVNEIVSEVQPAPEPVPSPAPDPGLDPLPDPDPALLPPDVKDYAFDLRNFFPFCLPFDLIRLIQVLDADPKAPHFEIPIEFETIDYKDTFVIDLEFLDPAVEIFRICIVVSFIISLIMVTGKLIHH